jgi:hypothetical protein
MSDVVSSPITIHSPPKTPPHKLSPSAWASWNPTNQASCKLWSDDDHGATNADSLDETFMLHPYYPRSSSSSSSSLPAPLSPSTWPQSVDNPTITPSILCHDNAFTAAEMLSCCSQQTYQRWSADEDKILSDAIMETSGGVPPYRWKRISLEYFMGLRTEAQCRYRWIRAIDPQLKMGNWTRPEDDLIRMLRHDQGMDFHDIARELPGRRVETIRDRYRQILDPSLRRSDPWSDDEKAKLFELVTMLGHNWKAIVGNFPGRSDASCKNTWYNAIQSRKRKAMAFHKSST